MTCAGGRRHQRFLGALALVFLNPLLAANVLFDATKHEMAGNADWIVDADAHDLVLPAFPCSGSTAESNPARFPTPPQAGISAATPETYWTGGISAWAVDLARAGHTIETLPPGAAITFGEASNAQDLSHYELFVVVEPQNPFSAAEKSAILAFVQSGGGLFLVADHETSDRDCDGWDAPHVWNDLTGATSPASAGAFGIWFRVDGSDASPSEDWFDDAVDANVATDPLDPVIHGPFGSGAGGLGLFGSTSMEIHAPDNASVRAHVWRTGQAHDEHRVTFATASYGSGRVAAIGDSSPADDDTGDPSDSLHPGWDKASGGVANREIHLNACAWLLQAAPDTTPPAIVAGPSADPADCSARVSWTTDEPASASVEFGPDATYGSTVSAPGFATAHAIELAPLAPASSYHYRVTSSDTAGNGPTASADATFTTASATAPALVAGPQVTGTTGSTATISWTTDETATSLVEYGTTPAYGSSASSAALLLEHALPLPGLSPLTTYHYRVGSADACGNGPSYSADATFQTGPASIDVSGWTLRQSGSSQTFTLPPGTTIPSAGYLIVARDATRAEFEATFPSMPASTVFLNSNASGSCAVGCVPQVNGGESFELYDATSVKKDGPTITMGENNAYQRAHPADPPGSVASWSVVPEASANPGQGAGPGSGAGVVIGEMADAADYRKEFVELYYDAAPEAPDTQAPGAVSDLRAIPTSATTVRLEWTASGDDGALGTASAYDVRTSSRRILSAADFAAATPLAGEPAPHVTGFAEQWTVSGLAPDAPAYFALAVVDEASNRSAHSNDAWAVTAPPGGAAPVDHLVVSQLRVSGSNDDVVELYNPTAAPIPLAGHSLQYLAFNGNFGFRGNLSAAASVPAHGWYLVAGSGYAGSPARDEALASNLSATAGHALLVSKTTNVSGCADAAIVDRAGYGATASCPEGGAGHNTATPLAGQSVSRKPGGAAGNGQDTDVNDVDFSAPAAPAFHDAASTPATPSALLGNVRATLYLSRGVTATNLVWGAAAGASGYRVYRGGAAASLSLWATTSGQGATSTSDAENPVTIFFYVVRATDGSGESAD